MSTVIETSVAIPHTLRAFYDTRTPLGTNINLWNLMNALVVATTDRDLMKLRDHGGVRTVVSMINQDVFELLAGIVSSGELFKDWPVCI